MRVDQTFVGFLNFSCWKHLVENVGTFVHTFVTIVKVQFRFYNQLIKMNSGIFGDVLQF